MKIFTLLLMLFSVLLLPGKMIENLNTSCKYHLQGIAADETGIYWSFTDTLIKTDYKGKVLKETKLPGLHGGDLAIADGDIFVAVIVRDHKHIAANNNCRSAIFQYDRELKLKKKYPLPIKDGIDGIAFYKNRFYVAPGAAKTPKKTVSVFLYDRNIKLLKKFTVTTPTMKKYGAQNLTVINGSIAAGFYDDGKTSPLLDPETLKVKGELKLRHSVGLTKVPASVAGNDHTYLMGRLKGKKGDWKCSAIKITITKENKVIR